MAEVTHDEVVQRTAKVLGMPASQVERVIDAYADAYIQLDRKARLEAARHQSRTTTTTTEFPAQPDGTAPPPAEVARETAEQPVAKASTPRKRSAKVKAAAKPSDAEGADQSS